MALTKADLKAIDGLVAKRVSKLATKKDLQKLDKKFDGLFNFLDKDYLRVKKDVREIQSHLHLSVSDF